jgi:nicotinic acid mononucleotide adenylyltransferase
MCHQAATLFPRSRCRICAIEKEIGGRSITLNTVRELKWRKPQELSILVSPHLHEPYLVKLRFSLVIGLDNWLVRDKWEGFDQLEKECRIIVVGKGDQPRLPDIRSTMIRSMLAAGEDVSNMLPRSVLSYIAKHRLYGYRKA